MRLEPSVCKGDHVSILNWRSSAVLEALLVHDYAHVFGRSSHALGLKAAEPGEVFCAASNHKIDSGSSIFASVAKPGLQEVVPRLFQRLRAHFQN